MPKPTVQRIAHDIIVLGKIVGAHGVRGDLKVHPFADDASLWSRLSGWWVGQESDAPQQWQYTSLVHGTCQGNSVIAHFEHISDRTSAEALTGKLVGAPRAFLPSLRRDEYYWADLLGLDVVNTHGELLGQVQGLIETAANDVLQINSLNNEGPERLIPFISVFVLEVDLQAKRILVDWNLDW